ncbi:MAG TPA: ATP-binding cassette domain-containing protein [Permianibacter sp.]|nr:ATP-binding cassette domain-containing protein [Permianibacter sp.]
MITLSSLSLRRGSRELLHDVNLTLHAGEHVGLIGANGCGKTSLLLLLRGEIAPDAGELQLPANLRLAWAEQETPAIERSALDYVIDGDRELRDTERELAAAEDAHDGMAIGRLHGKLDAIDAYRAPVRAAQLLVGLGFPPDSHNNPIRSFSGGWRMRLNLAQALMTRSDLLLLDEPTNHLDLDAVIWLEDFLRRWSGTLIVISHDREFLDGICSHIVHVEQQTLNKYSGDYSSFEKQRAERMSQAQQAYAKQQAQRAHLQSFVDRFKAKASKAKQAQSRMKALEKLTLSAPIDRDSAIEFEFPAPEKMPSPMLSCREVSLGYPLPDGGSKTVLKNVKLTLMAGHRIGLLGRNGAGKSTFIRFLANELKPLSGERQDGHQLRIGYFAQHTLESLRLDQSPLWHLRQLDPLVPEQNLRNFLGGFGFQGERALSPVAPFSGGEKARVALALLVWQKPHLLLLDEPTNHLDIDMRETLTEALQSFEGALVLVSHDRHLLRATCDEFWLVDSGRAEPFDGDLEDYAKWLLKPEDGSEVNSGFVDNKPGDSSQSAAARKDRKRLEAEQRKLRQPLQQKIQQLDKQLAQLSARLAEIDAVLADSGIYADSEKARLKKLLDEQASLRKQQAAIEEDWMLQSEALEALIKAQEAELA